MGKICIDVTLPQVPFVQPIHAKVVDIKGGSSSNVQSDFLQTNSSEPDYIKNRGLIATKDDIRNLEQKIKEVDVDSEALEPINEKLAEIESNVQSISEKVEGFEGSEEKLEKLETLVAESNSEMYGRLELVEQKNSKLTKKINNAITDIESFQTDVNILTNSLEELEKNVTKSVDGCNEAIDGFKVRIYDTETALDALQQKVEELDKQIDSEAELDALKEEIASLKTRVKALEDVISTLRDSVETLVTKEEFTETVKEEVINNIKEETYTKEEINTIIEAVEKDRENISADDIVEIFYEYNPPKTVVDEQPVEDEGNSEIELTLGESYDDNVNSFIGG